MKKSPAFGSKYSARIILVLMMAILGTACETQPRNTPVSEKIDSKLGALVNAWSSGEDFNQAAQRLGLTVSKNKEVLIDIYVTIPASEAAPQLANLGMTVQTTNEAARVVEGLLPISKVAEAADLGFTKALLAVTAFGTDKIP